MVSTRKILLGVIVGFVFGTFMFATWIPRARVAGAPIITGTVISRTATTHWGIPSADLLIRLPDETSSVHAYVGQKEIDSVPGQVRFHYTGDPTREVFLFEHEENPLWIAIFCWGVSGVLGLVAYRRWDKRRSAAAATTRSADARHD